MLPANSQLGLIRATLIRLRPGSGCSHRQPARRERGECPADAVDRDPSVEPRNELADAFLERRPRPVAEDRAGLRDIRKAVAYIADAALAGDLGLNRDAERVGEQARDLIDRHRAP